MLIFIHAVWELIIKVQTTVTHEIPVRNIRVNEIEVDVKIRRIFRPLFPRGGGGERARGTRYEAQYHTDDRPCRIWRDGSRREYQQHDQQWCTSGAACVCVRVWAEASPPRGPRERARISEGAIFETSGRRARDLRSAVVASIITATIVPEFIGISIKAARATVACFLINGVLLSPPREGPQRFRLKVRIVVRFWRRVWAKNIPRVFSSRRIQK